GPEPLLCPSTPGPIPSWRTARPVTPATKALLDVVSPWIPSPSDVPNTPIPLAVFTPTTPPWNGVFAHPRTPSPWVLSNQPPLPPLPASLGAQSLMPTTPPWALWLIPRTPSPCALSPT